MKYLTDQKANIIDLGLKEEDFEKYREMVKV